MRYASYYIVAVATGLVFYHSYQAWLWITGEWYTALGWSFMMDSLAMYLWFNRANKAASVASTMVVLVAFFHLSSNVTSKIDFDSFAKAENKSIERLQEIGKGAAKYGNHEATNKVVSMLSKSDRQDEIGTVELVKLVLSMLVQMVSLVLGVYGQIYAIKKLLEAYHEPINSKEVSNEEEKKEEDRNYNESSSDQDLAKVALKELEHCRVRFGGISERQLVAELRQRNITISAPSIAKARNTLSGNGEPLKRDGLKLMIHRLRKAKP